jgi:hypothetical protein
MAECELVAFLHGRGPQRMPLQACCVFGLVDRADPPVCVAATETPVFVAAAERPGSKAATS